MRTIHGAVPHHTIDHQNCRDALEDGWRIYEDSRDNPARSNAAHAAATECLFEVYRLTNRHPAEGRFARRAAREVFARCVIETYRTRLNPMTLPWETVQLEMDALRVFVGLDAPRPLDGLLDMLQSVGRPYLARGRVLVGTVADVGPNMMIAYRGRRFSMEAPLHAGSWGLKREPLSIGTPIPFTTTGSHRDGLPLVSSESGAFLKNAVATLFWPILDNYRVDATLVRSKGIGFISAPTAIVRNLDRANLSEIARLFRLRHLLTIPEAAQQADPIQWYATHIADRLFPNHYQLLSYSPEGVMLGSGSSQIPDALLFDFALMLRKLSNQPRLSIEYVRPHGTRWTMRLPTVRRDGFGAQDAPPRAASNIGFDGSAI